MVEKPIASRNDPFLAKRLATLNLRLSSIGEEVVCLDRQIGARDARITPGKVVRFAKVMRGKLRNADNSQVRRSYARAFVGKVGMIRGAHDSRPQPDCRTRRRLRHFV